MHEKLFHSRVHVVQTHCQIGTFRNTFSHAVPPSVMVLPLGLRHRGFAQPWIMVRPLAKSAMLEAYLRLPEEHACKRVPGAHDLVSATPEWRGWHVLRRATTARVTQPPLHRRLGA